MNKLLHFKLLNTNYFLEFQMKIDFEKIKYSKCPTCKEHGIPAFSKISRRHNPTLKCKYCNKCFL